MFEQVTASEAAGRSWDLVIVGSSFAAMFFLRGLPGNPSVLIIEKGPIVPHEAQFAQNLYGEDYTQKNTSGHEKEWVAHIGFGGNSNCWWGQTPRFLPADFRLFEDHGLAAPWPIDYDTVEPFYSEVEAIMEIAGPSDDQLRPRSAPFPFPPHRMTRSGQRLTEHDERHWLPVATARSNGGSRAQCCVNGVCWLCPIDAKFTILNGISAFLRPEARLLVQAEVRQVVIEGGRATGVEIRNADSSLTEIRAGAVALAANAIANPAILMRSGVENPALGRYLNEQLSDVYVLDVDTPNLFGGTSITGHGYALWAGGDRKSRAAVLIENVNAPPLLRPERGRLTHRMQMRLIAEDLPQAENRVTIGPDGEPEITWIGHSEYGRRGLAEAARALPGLLPFKVERMEHVLHSKTEAHIQGTHRMGRDPASSVVDDGLRVHGVKDLFCLGAGAFPTCGIANPTLTLSALSLRAGRMA